MDGGLRWAAPRTGYAERIPPAGPFSGPQPVRSDRLSQGTRRCPALNRQRALGKICSASFPREVLAPTRVGRGFLGCMGTGLKMPLFSLSLAVLDATVLSSGSC